jgi:hypothetical protein
MDKQDITWSEFSTLEVTVPQLCTCSAMTKQLNLKLKTWPKQLLGYLPDSAKFLVIPPPLFKKLTDRQVDFHVTCAAFECVRVKVRPVRNITQGRRRFRRRSSVRFDYFTDGTR